MRHLASLTCAATLLSLLAAVSPAEAAPAPTDRSARVAATTRTDCDDYASHRVCVVLHRNAKGRVWATASVDKISGKSNHRYAHAYLYSRACRGTDLTLRAEKATELDGEKTASARTATIAWDKRVYYQARVVGGWSKVKYLPSGVMQIKNRKDVAVATPPLSACPA